MCCFCPDFCLPTAPIFGRENLLRCVSQSRSYPSPRPLSCPLTRSIKTGEFLKVK